MLLTNDEIVLFKRAIKDGRIVVRGFDLETTPSQFWCWGTGQQYVGINQLVEGTHTKIIISQYKDYLIDKKSKYLEWDWDSGQGDDSSLVDETVRLLNEADIVIAQNGKSFDIKVLQERAKALGLPPVSIDFMIDTLTSSRSSFRAMSHKLDYRSKQLGFGGKHKMELQDWIDVVNGDQKALNKMIKYGLKDNDDTESVFWRELPYYNLPQATINKIRKLILGDTPKIKPLSKLRCVPCSKSRQRRFDVDKKKILCNNCGSKEIVEN